MHGIQDSFWKVKFSYPRTGGQMAPSYIYHLARVRKFSCLQSVEIDAARQVDCIPPDSVGAGRFLFIHEFSHNFTKSVVHVERNM